MAARRRLKVRDDIVYTPDSWEVEDDEDEDDGIQRMEDEEGDDSHVSSGDEGSCKLQEEPESPPTKPSGASLSVGVLRPTDIVISNVGLEPPALTVSQSLLSTSGAVPAGDHSTTTHFTTTTLEDDLLPTEGSSSAIREAQAAWLVQPDDTSASNIHLYRTISNFAQEHSIFLQTVLDLVQERDKKAPEVGMLDPVILKAGPLKKASQLMNGVWKNKYVEIRRGMLSYFENNYSGTSSANNSGNNHSNAPGQAPSEDSQQLKRKDIPLQAHSCRCRPVRLHQKAIKMAPGGAIFELAANGSKRLWMAKSREERQVWIQAIHNATVGGSVTQSNESELLPRRSRRSPFRNDTRRYTKLRSSLRQAKSKSDYLSAFKETKIIRAPVKWIAKHIETEENAFREENVEMSVEQLWRDLQRDSVMINGERFQGDGFHGPQQIMGGVARQLMLTARQQGNSSMTESQAIAYARDILLSGNRTRSGGDSYYCVKTLCGNDDLVVVTPSAMEVEPVSILIAVDESEEALDLVCDMSGWIRTKNRTQRSWQKLYFVLSEGTLSYYEEALPRPHRLRGQMVLSDATISITKAEAKTDEAHQTQNANHFILTISIKEGTGTKERYMVFDSEARLLDWTYALERMSKSLTNAKKSHRRRISIGRPEPSKQEESDTTAFLAEKATKDHGQLLGLDSVIVDNRLAMYHRKSHVILKIGIQAASSYNVCTLDPQGDEKEDIWASIRANFTQTFRITGGANGRLVRGEEVVRISIESNFNDELLVPDLEADPVIPSSPSQRRRLASGLFRTMNSNQTSDVAAELSFDRPSQSM